MIVSILRYIGLFLVVFCIQMFIIDNLFIGTTYSFLFQPQLVVMFILLLPPSMPHIWMILSAFISGFIFDASFHTKGIHAAVCTLIGFTRFYVTRDIENIIGTRDEEIQSWTIKKGRAWKWMYFSAFIFIYHFFYILIESQGSNFFSRGIPAILVSTTITFFIVLVLENLLYKPAGN